MKSKFLNSFVVDLPVASKMSWLFHKIGFNPVTYARCRFLSSPAPFAASIPFAKAKGGQFVQDAPHLENSYEGDVFLQRN